MGQVTHTDGAGRDAGRRQTPGRRQYKPRARACRCGCGEMVTPTAQAPHKAYFNAACRKRDNRRKLAKLRKSEPVAPVLELVTCAHCGKTFFAEKGRGARFCKPGHKTASWRLRRSAAIRAVAELTQTDVERVAEAVEHHGLAKATKFLHKRGFQYDERARSWVRVKGDTAA